VELNARYIVQALSLISKAVKGHEEPLIQGQALGEGVPQERPKLLTSIVLTSTRQPALISGLGSLKRMLCQLLVRRFWKKVQTKIAY